MKKILLATALAGFTFTGVQAQDFNFASDTVKLATTGVPTLDDKEDMNNRIYNLTASPLTVNWNLITPAAIPASWRLFALCDNVTCYPYDNAWATGEVKTTAPINPGEFSDFRFEISAPTSSPNVVGVVKFQVVSAGQTDTVYFIVDKTAPTGINIVKVNDDRVATFPNPATNSINLFVNKDLNANTVSIVDIKGSRISTVSLNTASEITKLSLESLSSGIYLLQVQNKDGAILTTRKITKR